MECWQTIYCHLSTTSSHVTRAPADDLWLLTNLLTTFQFKLYAKGSHRWKTTNFNMLPLSVAGLSWSEDVSPCHVTSHSNRSSCKLCALNLYKLTIRAAKLLVFKIQSTRYTAKRQSCQWNSLLLAVGLIYIDILLLHRTMLASNTGV